MNVFELIPQFPLEIAIPYRFIVNTKQEFINRINMYNGYKRIFYSLYSKQHLIIDKVFLDLDSNKSYDNVIKLHNWCTEKDYKHSVIFSGGGFHFYFYTNKKEYKNPKLMLLQTQHKIAQINNLSIGDPVNSDIDNHIVGDIARVVTLPGSYNIKRRKYAQSLSESELMSGIENIKQNNRQSFTIHTYGSKLLNLEDFAFDVIEENVENYNNIDIKLQENNKDIKDLPKCLHQILLDVNSLDDWRGRWIATCLLQEHGYTNDAIDKLAKKYFSAIKRTDNYRNNYEHWKKVKVLEYSERQICPSCDILIREGRCPKKCRWYK